MSELKCYCCDLSKNISEFRSACLCENKQCVGIPIEQYKVYVDQETHTFHRLHDLTQEYKTYWTTIEQECPGYSYITEQDNGLLIHFQQGPNGETGAQFFEYIKVENKYEDYYNSKFNQTRKYPKPTFNSCTCC